MISTSNILSPPMACAAKSYIARADERSEDCFILLEGIVLREKKLHGGQRQIVGVNVPGDVCGLATLSDGLAHSDMIALSPVSVFPLARHRLAAFARASTDLLYAVWREMAREMAISATWVSNLGRGSAYQRIAHFLCEFEARLRAARPDAFTLLEWPGTQSDIGAATGLSLVHVNRTMRQFEADRILTCGRRIRILDVAKLRAVSRFDATYLAFQHKPLGDVLLSRISEMEAHSSEKAFNSLAGPLAISLATRSRMSN